MSKRIERIERIDSKLLMLNAMVQWWMHLVEEFGLSTIESQWVC